MFFSATYHDAETAKRITDKHHFTWTHLVEAKDMMAWIGYEGFPLTIVVDKKGIVRHAVYGTNETKREELLTKIKEAEAEWNHIKYEKVFYYDGSIGSVISHICQGSWGRFFWSFFKLNEMQMRQVIKHRDIRLLNMIRRTDPVIPFVFFLPWILGRVNPGIS